MRRPAKLSLRTAAALFGFSIGTWFLGSGMGLRGLNLWILRGGLWTLGIIAAALILWYLLRFRQGKAQQAAPDDIDVVFASAGRRIAQSRPAGVKSLTDLPMVVVLGPTGSSKTSIIVRSGLNPDLLAGEVFHGDVIAPTSSVNLWYAHGNVFVEAGGRLLDDPDRWSRLARLMRPRRLRAALTGRPLPARLAVVCFGIDEFLRMRGVTGSGDLGGMGAASPAARNLRERLAQLAKALGIRLPVYVVFTKSDLIPHFTEFVRNLTASETSETLGATLRIPPAVAAGLYADREFQRLSNAHDRVFESLARLRLDLLPREHDVVTRAGAYELPREFRKLSPVAIDVLIELCRPSELDVSPVLRGFYFCGVRPIVIGEAPESAVPRTAYAADAGPVGATQVFDPRIHEVAVASSSPSSSGQRKVPQWLFLGRLFSDVLLRDHVARAMAAGGVGVNRLRRLGLATAGGLGLLLVLGLAVSFVTNRRLERQVLNAAEGIETLHSFEPGLPPLDALQRLDSARARVAQLTRYERDGAPWRLRWGLYTGHRLQRHLRQLYFSKFEEVLLDPARRYLVGALSRLDATSDHAAAYVSLKAYLMTTANPERIDSTFLVPQLTARWLDGRQIDEQRQDLARTQFEFYAGGLCNEYDCASPGDPTAITGARRLLRQFTQTQPIYQELIAKVATQVKPANLNFNELFPGSEGTVVNSYQVPGAFTESGWRLVRDWLNRPDELVGSEDWVLGEAVTLQQDPIALAGELRSMYLEDYIRYWREYLRSARILRYSNARDAARKLGQLDGSQSALLQLLALASQETDQVDSVRVGRAFQPVHIVTPRDSTNNLNESYMGDLNEPYMRSLASLRASVENVVEAQGDGAEAAKTDARERARTTDVAVTQLAQKFDPHPDAAAVGVLVENLLRAPIDNLDALLRAAPIASGAGGAPQVERRAQALCRELRPLLAQYPFSPDAATDATLDEVARMLQPDKSAFWNFYNEMLLDVLEKQGDRYVAREGASVDERFLEFFNKTADISEAIWQGGSEASEPRFRFTFRPRLNDQISSVELIVDGLTKEFTPERRPTELFSWEGSRARDVRLTVSSAGRPITVSRSGTWAIFRLFGNARWGNPSGGRYVVQLDVTSAGPTLEAEVSLAGAPILDAAYLGNLQCVSQVLRR